MPFVTFAVLNATGTIARLALFRWLGDVFDDEIQTVVDFIGRVPAAGDDHQHRRRRRRHRLPVPRGKGELFGLTQLEQDLEPDDETTP